ncbi:hypothetical protein [Helicobacter macacae]|uniref:Uncharacterized protein n=1 Tax=Helicobacter macacae MIT 99-5501 TaxID=1357400 RepID=V8CA45_9HELI|nr:hypothetical protein [Helicobacter macacae]ETD24239.1 hypothetical protein HMPREF2086_00989 [Helicobacter macacae MIT 99-5501]
MQNSDKIQCKGCEESKPQKEFYLVDGGLGIEGIENLRFEICKGCVREHNKSHKWINDRGQECFTYLLFQHISCYCGAMRYIDKSNNSDEINETLLKSIVDKIDNGWKSYKDDSKSLEKAVKNFLSLFGKVYGSSDFNDKQKWIFHRLNINKENLSNIVDKILQEDYQTFKQFKQTQGVRQ